MVTSTIDSTRQSDEYLVMPGNVASPSGDYAGDASQHPQTPPVTLDTDSFKPDDMRHTPSPKTPSKYTDLSTPPPTSSSTKDLGSHDSGTPVSPQRLSELSDSLRTRLAYAFMKINKGWTDYSLDHLESLQSRQEAQKVIAELANSRRQNQNFRFPDRISKQEPLKRSFNSHKSTSSQTNIPSHRYSNSTFKVGSSAALHRRTSSDSVLAASAKNLKRNMNQASQSPLRRGKIRRVSFTSKDETMAENPTVSLAISTADARPEADAAKSLMFLSSPQSTTGKNV